MASQSAKHLLNTMRMRVCKYERNQGAATCPFVSELVCRASAAHPRSKVIGRHGCTLPGRVAGWGPCLSLRAPSTCCLESRNLDLNSSIGKLLLGRPAGRQAGRHNTQSHGCRLDRFHRLLLNGMLAPVSMLCILKLSLSRTEDIAIRTRKG